MYFFHLHEYKLFSCHELTGNFVVHSCMSHLKCFFFFFYKRVFIKRKFFFFFIYKISKISFREMLNLLYINKTIRGMFEMNLLISIWRLQISS